MVVLAHWRAQSFKFEQFTDLWDFCEQLETIARDTVAHDDFERERFPEIADECSKVKTEVDNIVGRSKVNGGRQGFAGIDFQHAYGLSVYFPWQMQSPEDHDLDIYGELNFACEGESPAVYATDPPTGWADFLKGVPTQYQTRGQETEPKARGGDKGGDHHS